MNKKSVNSNLILLLVVIIWGTGFSAVEYALKANFSTLLILTLRFLIATLSLIVVFNKKLLSINKKELFYGSISGTVMFLGFYFQTKGQNLTTVSNSAFFTATNVIIIPFTSWIIFKIRPTYKTILLTFLCLIGVAIISFKGTKISLGYGDILVLICAVFFATQVSILDKATKIANPTNINFIQIVVAFLLSLIFLIMFPQDYTNINISKGLIPILYIGIFTTSICYFLQTYAQKHTSSTNTGIILSIEGLFGSLFAVMLGFERLSANILIGGGIIILASVLSSISDVNNDKL